MSETLRTRFLEARQKSLDLLSQGPEAIDTFYQFWSGLELSLQAAIEQRTVDEETLVVAHRVTTWIEIISGRIFELFKQTDTLAASLQHDLDTIFANLHIDRESSPSLVPSSNAAELLKSSASNASASLPPYIQSAYAWLLQNLHNPYPSKDTKGTFARETGSSLKDIENWFINVRKRIGWNKLRLKYYENKRSKIVDAATRFFKQIPQPLPLESYTTQIPSIDPMVNLDLEFQLIEDRARKLYSDKLFETPLATKHDGRARGLTRAHSQGEKGHRGQVAKYRGAKDLQHLSAYPSPERSPERSPTPSPERSPENSAAVPLPIPDATPATCRKRRNHDRDSPELDVEDCRGEPQKRSRLDSYQISRDLAVTSLPSPAASMSDIPCESSVTPSDQAPSGNDCISLPVPPLPVVPSGKRKRRLSDANGDGPSKRPHNALAVPRLQTVSDPLPLSGPIISELHKTVFDRTISDTIPGPVSVESLDDFQVEVDFYNYNASPPDTMQPFWLANPSDPCPAAVSLPSAANSESPSLDKSRVPDPSFDFLFETYLKDLDIPQASTDISFPDIPSHDSALFSFENILATQPPQEDVLSDSLSFFQIPWDFDDSFPGTVPSTGTPFSSSVTPEPNSPQNEKEAKLKQIEALRAQLQNLEAEL